MWTSNRIHMILLVTMILMGAPAAQGNDQMLGNLIQEALVNNPDLLALQAGIEAAEHRIPQAKALPDPMIMAGYQNEGYDSYTYGDMPDAQWMFSASQMFPFYGKRALKGEMAFQETESLRSEYESARLDTIARVKELYYELFLAHKNVEIIQDRIDLFSRIEDAALARYSSGMAPQQEVLMAQTEKYMLLEREEMYRQTIQATTGMLNSLVGRPVNTAVEKPQELTATLFPYSLDLLLEKLQHDSPMIRSRQQMIREAEAGVEMARKEYFPDVTLTGSSFQRKGDFDDMWSLTAQINLPLFYRQKQRQGVLEAQARLMQNERKHSAAHAMLAARLKDSYSMFTAAESLMDLYKEGLIPKTYQDFQSALTGYGTGQVEAITVISRLKSLLDYELLYWAQLVEREKAIARVEALVSIADEGKKGSEG